jgi:hypothetical protein
MRKAMLMLVVFGFVGTLLAQGPYDGTWKISLDQLKLWQSRGAVRLEFLLQNSTFQCMSCNPKINVNADGTDRAVSPANKDFDTMAVRLVNDNTVETICKKGGKTIETSRYTVSGDGKELSLNTTEYPKGGEPPYMIKNTFVRVGAASAGSHALSGSWRLQIPEFIFTIKSSNNSLVILHKGKSYETKLDGKDAPLKVKGDSASYTASLTRVNDRSIDGILKRDGKTIAVIHLTISADGKTMTMKADYKGLSVLPTIIPETITVSRQ